MSALCQLCNYILLNNAVFCSSFHFHLTINLTDFLQIFITARLFHKADMDVDSNLLISTNLTYTCEHEAELVNGDNWLIVAIIGLVTRKRKWFWSILFLRLLLPFCIPPNFAICLPWEFWPDIIRINSFLLVDALYEDITWVTFQFSTSTHVLLT